MTRGLERLGETVCDASGGDRRVEDVAKEMLRMFDGREDDGGDDERLI